MRTLTIITILLLSSISYSQTWQSQLEQHFDIVETFDQLQDWHTTLGGSPLGDVVTISDMPKKLNGSPSIWEYYSYWGSVPGSQRPAWIKFHGTDKVWKATGKSVCIDYGGSGNGPSRFAFSIGNSPDAGYDECYLFYLIRVNKEFFPRNGTTFKWFGYFKTLQIDAGFRDVFDWGTTEEQSKLPNDDQLRHVYGLTDICMNWQPYGGYLVPQYNASYSNNSGTGWTFSMYGTVGTGTHFTDLVLANDWFAIEYHVILSNPHGSNNGLIELWLYDKNGNVIGNDKKPNIVTMADATNWAGGGYHVFNHRNNKFVFGGNRYDPDFAGCESHYYLDDIIVDEARIGIRYFNLVNGNVVEPVRDLRIIGVEKK